MNTQHLKSYINSSYKLRILERQQKDNSLTISVAADFLDSNIVIDITSPANRNIIVRLMDTDRKIVKMYSWYLMTGRNMSSIKKYDELENGEYTLQMMNIGGEIIFSSTIFKQ